MTKRRIILVSVVFFSIAVFTVQTLSQARSSNRTVKPPDAERLRNMTEEERKRESVKRREQRENAQQGNPASILFTNLYIPGLRPFSARVFSSP